MQTEVELLSSFSGNKDECCLKQIAYSAGVCRLLTKKRSVHMETFKINGYLCDVFSSSEMVFSNGCRAPPWRQVLGEICYLRAALLEGDELHITASTEGYYINSSKVQDVLVQHLQF